MDTDIRQQLIALNDDFLEASVGDFLGFNERFQKLTATISRAMDQHLLSEETLTLAHAVAQSIAILAELFINLREEEDSALQHLKADTLKHAQRASPPPTLDIHHIPAAYEWLLSNLHNPYPSRTMRAAIARGAQCPRETIDKWFGDIRKRTGWARLCKERFSNKKSEIIDAATRFFIAPDRRRPLDPDCEVDFEVFAASVRESYRSQASSRPPSSLIADAPSMSYPSPSSSPESAIFALDETELSGPAYCEALQLVPSPGLSRTLPLVLPSPTNSLHDPFIVQQHSTVQAAGPLSRKRKRRLSEGNLSEEVLPRRNIRPRLQTVSDSFVQSAFDPRPLEYWFQHELGTSQSVSEPSNALQVELFDFSDLDFGQLSSTSYLSSPTVSPLPLTPPDIFGVSHLPTPPRDQPLCDDPHDFSFPFTSDSIIAQSSSLNPLDLFFDNLLALPPPPCPATSHLGIWSTDDFSLPMLANT
ncbi:hypothetical protein BDN72DRAFT_852471 [Pluteus cervinus]|uniref:Uncharacterized protein n=1 Tax=Pluteus cervinus TaxID=181527 RepID=A0ACD3BGV0_9AGAR|nr:hypothetical protein BDN72DRAFT_852471 [Pluteus cervinus]